MKRFLRSVPPLFLTLMLILSTVVLALLSAGAARTEQRAARTNRAVLLAASAADAFYAAPEGESLAALLGGSYSPEAGSPEAFSGRLVQQPEEALELVMDFSREGSLTTAVITVYERTEGSSAELLYSLRCERFLREAGGK